MSRPNFCLSFYKGVGFSIISSLGTYVGATLYDGYAYHQATDHYPYHIPHDETYIYKWTIGVGVTGFGLPIAGYVLNKLSRSETYDDMRHCFEFLGRGAATLYDKARTRWQGYSANEAQENNESEVDENSPLLSDGEQEQSLDIRVESDDDTPHDYRDPIFLNRMEIPYQLQCGHNFDYKSLYCLLVKRLASPEEISSIDFNILQNLINQLPTLEEKPTCPCCRSLIESAQPNIVLKTEIDNYLEKNPASARSSSNLRRLSVFARNTFAPQDVVSNPVPRRPNQP